MKMKQRYSELDAIRGIAALMVVIYHYTIRYGEIYDYPVQPAFSFELGHFGVQLFFMVSGFVIFLTLDKTVHAADFIISRLSRLYPAYWIAVILTFSIVYLFSLPGREVGIESAIINLTMLQKWFRVANVDGVYWTLAVELSFYMIMFFIFVTNKLEKITLISLVWLCIIIFSKYLEIYQSVHIHWVIKLMFLLDYGNLFIAGIMFYKIMHENKASSYLALLISLITEYYLHGNSVFIVSTYFGIFFLFTKGYLTILSIKPLVFLGTISYSLYLIHQNVGYIVIQKLESNDLATPFSIIFFPLVISVSIATVMQIYIEKPSLLVIRNRWRESYFRKRLIAVN
ncbi:MAG: acyltransferase [Gammaproteobacteria bacterium]|nr:acyltransferase [Gammaproteobacteria bacterium]